MANKQDADELSQQWKMEKVLIWGDEVTHVQAFTCRLSPFTVQLPNGLHLLCCITPNGTIYTEKLIIRK